MDKMDIIPNRPIWKKIIHSIHDGFWDSLGYPATLSRRVHYGVLKAKRPHIQNTIWLRSVIKWQTWLNYEENHICYLHPGHNGDYDLLHRHIPQLDGLVSNTVIKNYRCDISSVGGLSSSNNSDINIATLDDFALEFSRELATPISVDQLRKNLDHHRLRLYKMFFSQYSWMPGRLYWNNIDGIQHFTAVRYLSIQLGVPVKLKGELNSFNLNLKKVQQLTDVWDLYLLPDKEVYGILLDCLLRVKIPLGISNAPDWENGENTKYRIIWLERDKIIPARVSRFLTQAGFASVNQYLLQQK
ncbi:hypothetical protein PAG44_21170 [Klebsiella pneumoniae]|uniref:DUF6685 family protein n=1 Tax=Klebsiella pneumoniae TaxID=573 RepID=UPI0025A7EDA0|nr:DUF6685 family protein [Klebsiella pneumoniae]EKW5451005.1 hypothetical protein [Klebsiella pneumoniae]MDR4854459.1 hypothetical protein [Klebsiella pneumoniae]